MKKSKITLLVTSLALVGALGAGATLAYFTDATSAENVLTMGNVDIELKDELSGNALDGVMPGQEISDEISLKNVGKTDAFVRLKVSFDGLSAEEIQATFVSNGSETKSETFADKAAAEARVEELATKDIAATISESSVGGEVIDLFENSGLDRKVNLWLTTSQMQAFVPVVTENTDGTKTANFYAVIPNIYNSGQFSTTYNGITWSFNYRNGTTPTKTITLEANESLKILNLATGEEITTEEYQQFCKRELPKYSIDTSKESYGYKWTVVANTTVTSYTVNYAEPVNYVGLNNAWSEAETVNEDGSVYYYYNEVLPAASEDVAILDSIKIPATWGNSYADKQFGFTVNVEAIQADYLEDSEGNLAKTSVEAFAIVDSQNIAIESFNK